MNILWLTNIPIPKIAKHISREVINLGGWLTGLSDFISNMDGIDLSICCPLNNGIEYIEGNTDNINYYCFPVEDINIYNQYIEDYFYDLVKMVNPNIIHIFGTEYPHALAMVNACERLNMLDKVVINIQGLVSIYQSHYTLGLSENIINKKINKASIIDGKNNFIKRSEYEINALKKVNHVIGRTDWDKACTYQINPEVNYHFCNENLRESFYKKQWDINKCKRYSIFVSQCSYPIKGMHFLIEALPLILKEFPNTKIYTTGKDFINIGGTEHRNLTPYKSYLRDIIKDKKLERYFNFIGYANEEVMCERFTKSHVFVSASTVENESNSISEAMILGVPIVSSFVGGVTNRLTHNEDAFMYQSDSPYMLAYYICEIFKNDEIALKFSKKTKQKALITNDREFNSNKMLEIYKEIYNNKK